jgi:hypothetical protein
MSGACLLFSGEEEEEEEEEEEAADPQLAWCAIRHH